MKDILNRITKLRQERKWSEYELAKNSGLTQSTISTWYRKDQVPTIPTLKKVCDAFGITLSQFFAEGEETSFLTSEQKEMLDNWSALSSQQQRAVLELLKSI
ncbi:MAG: helix-turn-helix domain-containing protein [Oscillospiraceae bacterium]